MRKMGKWEVVSEVFKKAEEAEKYNIDMFVNYFGHVDGIDVYMFVDKLDRHKEEDPDYSRIFDIDRASQEDVDKFLEEIQEVINQQK